MAPRLVAFALSGVILTIGHWLKHMRSQTKVAGAEVQNAQKLTEKQASVDERPVRPVTAFISTFLLHFGDLLRGQTVLFLCCSGLRVDPEASLKQAPAKKAVQGFGVGC